MPYSQNGYSANDPSVIGSFLFPRTSRKIALRQGSAAVCLLDFGSWFHENIEPLDKGIMDDWGFAVRPIRGSLTELSNHSSGTAEDLNAVKHPLGVATLRTYTATEVALIHRRLSVYQGVLRWGGDYQKRPDSMHVEIDKGPKYVVDVARAIKGGDILGGYTLAPHEKPINVVLPAWPVAWEGHAMGPNPALRGSWHDGRRDANERGRVKIWQRKVGVLADGIWGTDTTKATKSYQLKYRKKPTGVVDRDLWEFARNHA